MLVTQIELRRKAAALSFVAFISLIALIDSRAANGQEWKKITPDGTGISVEMPGDPKPTTQTVDTPAGKVEIVLYVLEVPKGAFLVNATTIPPNAPPATVDERLDGARNGAVNNSGGKLVSESKISINGHPGRQLLIENSMGLFIHARVFIVDKKLVQTVAVSDQKDATDDIKRFMDSLKLLKAGGEAKPGDKSNKLDNSGK